MTKFIFNIIVFSVFSLFVFLNAYGSNAYGSDLPDINTILMQSTVKIAGEKAYGTAFVIARNGIKDSGKKEYILVSAGHVFEDLGSDEALIFFRKKEKGEYKKVPCKIKIKKNGKKLWIKHPEADVGVMKINLPRGIELPLVTYNLLATNEILKAFEIEPGTDLCALGYPFGKESNSAGFPILRSGKIASYPLTPVKDEKTFLLDMKIFAGNSGGPVYFHETGWQKRGAPELFKQKEVQMIMGVVSSQVVVPEKIESPIAMEYTVRNYQMDLAVIVHAAYIRETIDMLDAKLKKNGSE